MENQINNTNSFHINSTFEATETISSTVNNTSTSLPENNFTESEKIAVGIVVPIVVIFLTTCFWCLWKRKRSKRRYKLGGANIELATRR